MKKIDFIKAMCLYLVMLAGCFTFTSCSNDNDEPIEQEDNVIEKINVRYSVFLSEDWYKFFDIEIKYTLGEWEDITYTTDINWIFEMSIPYSTEHNKYICNVVAKPKKNTPVIEDDSTYDLGYEINADIYGIKKDGSHELINAYNNKKRTQYLLMV